MKNVTRFPSRPTEGPNETLFAHAVQLAAAFVSNGDIRIRNGIHSGGSLQEIGDLIPELYRMLQDAAEECARPTQPSPDA